MFSDNGSTYLYYDHLWKGKKRNLSVSEFRVKRSDAHQTRKVEQALISNETRRSVS